MPEQFRDFFKEGLESYQHLPQDKRKLLVSYSTEEALRSSGEPEIKKLASILNINESDAGPLLSTSMVFVFGVGLSDEDPAHFVNAGQEAGVIDDSSNEAALDLAKRANERKSNLSRRWSQLDLEQQIIPNLTVSETTTDIRLRFKEDEVSAATAVAIVNIVTDIKSENLIFQLNSDQLRDLIDSLMSLQNDMKKAKEIVQQLT